MKYYLSSFKIGNEGERLKTLFPDRSFKIGFIPNALDFSGANSDGVKAHIESDVRDLRYIGLLVEVLDLNAYFGRQRELKNRVKDLGAVWVCGGNVFVLRQAMKLSGFDKIIQDLATNSDFLYGGYSAGCCVLSPRLDAYKIVDDATDTSCQGLDEVIWHGIGLIDFAFLPHFDSDHSESENIDREIEYCKKENIPFRTLRDGEGVIVESGV